MDYLNTIDVNSMPPHLLQLKKGVPIMLIRNLDSTRGHVNGTRYVIRELSKRVIYAEIAVGPYKGKQILLENNNCSCPLIAYNLLKAGNNFSGNTILIHRIKFLPEDRSLPIEMERSQFPGMVTKMVFV